MDITEIDDATELEDLLPLQTKLFLAAVMIKLKAWIKEGSLLSYYLHDKFYLDQYIINLVPKAMRSVLCDQDKLMEGFFLNPSKYGCIAKQIYEELKNENS